MFITCLMFMACLLRRGGLASESNARPEGREFESWPIRDARLCSWATKRTLKIVGPFYLEPFFFNRRSSGTPTYRLKLD